MQNLTHLYNFYQKYYIIYLTVHYIHLKPKKINFDKYIQYSDTN